MTSWVCGYLEAREWWREASIAQTQKFPWFVPRWGIYRLSEELGGLRRARWPQPHSELDAFDVWAHGIVMAAQLLWCPFSTRKWNLESFKDSPKSTELLSIRVRVPMQVYLTSKPMKLLPAIHSSNFPWRANTFWFFSKYFLSIHSVRKLMSPPCLCMPVPILHQVIRMIFLKFRLALVISTP